MKIIIIDCAQIPDKETFHALLEEKLEFPSWYGRNLDALHDCLTEVFSNTQLRFANWKRLEDTLGLYAKSIRRAVTHAAEENPCIEIVFEE